MSIGNKEDDYCTRDEYSKIIEEAGMIDINSKKKEVIKKEVNEFAKKTSVLEFNAIIQVKFT